MEKFRIAIIGAGFMARKHGDLLLQRGDVEIVGLVHPEKAKGTALLDQWRLPHERSFPDVEALLIQSPKPDAAYICIPPYAHTGQVESLARAGVHLFLEKPLALTIERAQSMVKGCGAAGITTQVGFHMRFNVGVQLLLEKIRLGVIGKPLLFQGRYWANFNPKGWWKSFACSGGQVFEQVCHIYDLARLFLGEPVRAHGAVARLGHQTDPSYTVDDTSASLITFAAGGMATITGSNCALPSRFVGDFRIVFDGGVADFYSEGDWRVIDAGKLTLHDGARITESIEWKEDQNPYAAATEDFLHSLRQRRPSSVPIEEGLRTLELVLRVRDECPSPVFFSSQEV
jgi:predicted dehydrogenase